MNAAAQAIRFIDTSMLPGRTSRARQTSTRRNIRAGQNN